MTLWGTAASVWFESMLGDTDWGELDWDEQPDTTRRFVGAPELALPGRIGDGTHCRDPSHPSPASYHASDRPYALLAAGGRRSSGMALRDGAAAISPAFLAAEAVPLSSLFSLHSSIPPQRVPVAYAACATDWFAKRPPPPSSSSSSAPASRLLSAEAPPTASGSARERRGCVFPGSRDERRLHTPLPCEAQKL